MEGRRDEGREGKLGWIGRKKINKKLKWSLGSHIGLLHPRFKNIEEEEVERF